MDMIILDREAILAQKLRIEKILVPEWGGYVFVRELNAQEMEQNGVFTVDPRTNKPDINRAAKIPIRICLKQVVNEAGERIFKDSDLPQLEKLHSSAVTKIADKVRTMSGLKTEGEKGEGLANWIEDNYPQIAQEYRDSLNPVEAAKENF